MIQFVVTVLCATHLKTCPIPEGYKSKFPAESKTTCEQRARKVVEAYGYRTADFTIRCDKQ